MAGNGPHLPADRLAEYSFQRDLDGWEPVLRELPDRAAVMVLEDEHGLRGVAGAGPARGDDLDAQSTGELYALYVDPDIWGAGYGAALHSAALTHLDGQGFPSAILWVLENNHRARRFYKGNGWQQDEHRGDFWGATTVRLSIAPGGAR